VASLINVKLIGYIYDKKILAEYYALGDIYCFASIAETFLLSAAEALACGIPVIGYDIPVVRELINDSVGVLVKKRDGESFARAIEDLLNNQNKLLILANNSRSLISDNYSQKLFYNKYINLYKELTK
jgi:glycosyltransferase involved in cell wall biosynthesis